MKKVYTVLAVVAIVLVFLVPKWVQESKQVKIVQQAITLFDKAEAYTIDMMFGLQLLNKSELTDEQQALVRRLVDSMNDFKIVPLSDVPDTCGGLTVKYKVGAVNVQISPPHIWVSKVDGVIYATGKYDEQALEEVKAIFN